MKPIDIYEHPFAFVDESITQMSGKMQYLEDVCLNPVKLFINEKYSLRGDSILLSLTEGVSRIPPGFQVAILIGIMY